MLRIVTDGAADMPDSWQSAYDIEVLPLRVNFGEETYIQGCLRLVR
jgi:fatty acid-binding protein DegV